MAIELTDDGTLDIVLRCSDCGEEMRYNYEPDDTHCPVCDADEHAGCYCALDKPAWENALMRHYDAFVEWAIEDATNDHECSAHADEDINEPDEDAITTSDHETFYQYGKPAFECVETVDGAYMLLINGFQIGGTVDRSGAGDATYSTVEDVIRAYMDRVQFWPDVWFISDHGNAHRINLTKQE